MSFDGVIHPLEAAHTEAAVSLFRRAFPPSEVNLTIMAAHGVHHYLANLITYPDLQPTHQLFGAWDGAELVGFVHYRALGEVWHLNYLAVHPEHQGQGIGGALLQHYMEMGRRGGYARATLDVYAENPARLWYERRGLRHTATNYIYEKQLAGDEIGAPSSPVTLLNWENAQAWQSLYGFSEFGLALSNETWRIGRLGQHYFRNMGLPPAEICAALRRLDPHRALLVLSTVELDEPALHKVSCSYRMQYDF